MEYSDDKIKNWVIDLATNDSQTALRSLYLYYFSRLCSFINYYVRSEETSEEVVSDVFLSIWEKRKQLLEIQNFQSYLYTIARNLAITSLRKESASRVELDTSNMDVMQQSSSNPEIELISLESMMQLHKAIDSLPEKCRQTYCLIREHNMKYKEVSEILNLSIKTVEAHMSLAIRRLRESLVKELKS